MTFVDKNGKCTNGYIVDSDDGEFSGYDNSWEAFPKSSTKEDDYEVIENVLITFPDLFNHKDVNFIISIDDKDYKLHDVINYMKEETKNKYLK